MIFTTQSEDVIIYILSFLDPPDITRLSLSCRKLYHICNLRIVWTNACRYHIIAKGYPSPPTSFPMPQLRSKVLAAYHLAHRWISGVASLQQTYFISGTSGTCVSDTIWYTMSLWDMSGQGPTMVARWSPRGAVFTGYTLNSEVGSKATLAISLQLDGDFSVKVFHVAQGVGSTYALQEIWSLATDMKPVTLLGDVLALADSMSQTAIWNWKDGGHAVLRHTTEQTSYTQHNDCLQVLFAHESVLVVRARSVHLFPCPDLRPHDSHAWSECYQIAQHSFGWVDGITAAICPHLLTSKGSGTPISILVRAESDDPWAQDAHYLELYSLFPNPDYAQQKREADSALGPSPYNFPPCKSYRIKSRRGALRCKQVVLGTFGTAVWLEPQERFATGLVTGLGEQWRWQDGNWVQRHECLRVGVFPGSLSAHGEMEEVDSRRVVTNEANNWTSFDYDELGGRIVLGTSFGKIVVIKV